MKILFLSEVFPYPTTEGRRASINPLLERLGRRHEIILVTFNDGGEPIAAEHVAHVSQYCSVRGVFPVSPVNLAIASRNLLERYPLSLYRYRSSHFRTLVQQIIEREHIDLVHSYGVNMAQFWDLAAYLPRVLGGPDCTYMFLGQLARSSKVKLWKRLYYCAQTRKMLRYEAEVFPRFHECYVLADQDREALLKANPSIRVSVTRTGVGVPPALEYDYRKTEGVPTVLISGNMALDVNVRAVMYFYRQVLPVVRAKFADAKLVVLGNSPDESIRQLSKSDPQVVVTGYVEDMLPFFAEADVYVCPLLAASGVQNRMLEAMASGKAIVSSSAAAAPMSLRHGEHVLVADNARDFAASVILLLGDPVLRGQLGVAARRAVEPYTWETVEGEISQLYQRAIDASRTGS